MSKARNQNGTYVDTGLLRDHVSRLRAEKKTATRLRDSIVAMRNSSDPMNFGDFNSVLRDANQLIEYFERMSRVLDNAGDEAIQLSREIGEMLMDRADETRYISSNTLML